MIASKVITLEALNNISFADLNNKSTDDFNPADFGFDQNPNEKSIIKPVISLQPSRQGTRSLIERAQDKESLNLENKRQSLSRSRVSKKISMPL